MEKISYIPKYTFADYCQWEGRWELIEGYPFAMTPLPSIEHQRISTKIARQLDTLVENCEKCYALNPVEWKIDEDIVVQPDNSVICHEATGNFLTSAPELIFEILSPSTAIKDRTVKYEIYQEQQVKYYVIIDPDKKQAEIFQLEDGKYSKILETKNDSFPFVLNECTIEFNFAKIWLK